MYSSIGDYVISNRRLGRGSSATVYLGKHTKTKKRVAIKKFEFTKNNKGIEKRAKRESFILSRLNHPNIIKMYDCYYDRKNDNFYMILEYCPKGSIRRFLGKGGYLDEKNTKKLMKQVVSALKYLISKGIFHRDIKPDNLLLSNNNNIRIIDFGLAKSGTSNSLCGSPLYMAPEILLYSYYDNISDVWSLGLLMFELLFGHHPYYKIHNIAGLISQYNRNIKIDIPPKNKPDGVLLSEDCIDILKKMLVKDVRKRIDWQKLFSHPWFESLKKWKYPNLRSSWPRSSSLKDSISLSFLDRFHLQEIS
jgi:serine/threonine protein kinase